MLTGKALNDRFRENRARMLELGMPYDPVAHNADGVIALHENADGIYTAAWINLDDYAKAHWA